MPDDTWRVQYYDDYLNGRQNRTCICAPDEREAAVRFCDQCLGRYYYVALMVEKDGKRFMVWVQDTVTMRRGLSSEEKPNARL